MKVIALKGGKHNGKSHVANIMKRKMGYSVLAFGDHLKEIMSLMFGFTHDQLYGDKKEIPDEEWCITPREAMQWFGTEIMREAISKRFGTYGKIWAEGYWAKFVIDKIRWKYSSNPDVLIVIDDLRHVADHMSVKEFCKSRGVEYKVFDVVRSGVEANDTHRSENEINSIESDGIIHNDIGMTEDDLEKELNQKI